jgi:hypothetical protein
LEEGGDRPKVKAALAVAPVYMAAIAAAEIMGTLVAPLPGVLCDIILIPMLVSHYVLATGAVYRRALPVLALAPLLRVLSLTTAARQIPPIYWYALIGMPLWVAAALTARLIDWQGVPTRGDGAQTTGRERSWPLQTLIAATGLPLGWWAFLLLRPAPLYAPLTWHQLLLGAVILFVFSAALEELIFRGLLLTVATEIYGSAGLFWSSGLFAAMYVGSLSWDYVLFMGAVGLFFGWCVRRTGSLWGVVAAHGLLNVELILMWPMLWR